LSQEIDCGNALQGSALAAIGTLTIIIHIYKCRMDIYTVEHWQENWDELISRVEDGESIGVTNGKNTAIMVPADDELIRIYTEQNNEGP
jgi:hypothetical protein